MPPAAFTSSRHISAPRCWASESTLSAPVCDSVIPMVMVSWSAANAGVAPIVAAATSQQSRFIGSSYPAGFFFSQPRMRSACLDNAQPAHLERQANTSAATARDCLSLLVQSALEDTSGKRNLATCRTALVRALVAKMPGARQPCDSALASPGYYESLKWPDGKQPLFI